MQLSGILVLALAVASGFAVPLNGDQDEDRMKNLISAATDFYSTQSAKMGPLKTPDFHCDTTKIPIIHDLISSNVSLTNGIYYGYNVVAIENIKTYPSQLNAQVNLRYPTVGIFGNYELDGKVLGHSLAKGAGNYTYEFYNVTNSLVNVRLFETEKKALRIESLGARLDLEDNKFEITGLSLEGLSVPTFEKIVNLVLHKAFDLNKRPVAKTWEFAFVRGLNKLIGDRTLEEVVEYLKEHKDDDFPQFGEYHEQMMAMLQA